MKIHPFLRLSVLIVLITVCLHITLFALPVIGRIDTFEDGTTMGWGGSAGGTPGPVWVADGGPGGVGDGYLSVSTGGFHLATRNRAPAWTGDYLGASVMSLEMDLNHLSGTTDLRIRPVLFGPGGAFATIARTPGVSMGSWTHYSFSLKAEDMVYVTGYGGTGVLEDTLSSVDTLLIRHDNETPTPVGTHPPHITATIGVDNITAVLRPYDVAWVFDNNGTTAYVLDAVDPASADIAPISAEDPTIFLELGKRYQVTVLNDAAHPFEVLAKGATSTGDTVLLSMASAGSMEANETVAWEDDAAGTVRFTLSDALLTAMLGTVDQNPGYRCGIHVGTMRGDFVICQGYPVGDVDGDCDTDLGDLSLFGQDWLVSNLVP